MENQYIQLYGSGTSVELAKKISLEINKRAKELLPRLYVNLSTYIQSGAIPTVWVGGNLSFDFREYDIDQRRKLNKELRRTIVSIFKTYFSDCKLNIQFNIGLEPSKFDYFVANNLFVNTGYITGFKPYNDKEIFILELSNFIENDLNDKRGLCGLDYVITIRNNSLIINQVFFDNYLDDMEKYKEVIAKFIDELDNPFKPSKFCVNTEYYSNENVRNNGFGSMVFHNSSSVDRGGNDYYGFISNMRPNNIFNPSPYSVQSVLLPDLNEKLWNYSDLKKGESVYLTLSGNMGNPTDAIETTLTKI